MICSLFLIPNCYVNEFKLNVGWFAKKNYLAFDAKAEKIKFRRCFDF